MTSLGAEEQRLVADLSVQPGWMILARRARDEKDKRLARLARDLYDGKTPDPVEIAYARGFFKGMDFLIRNPTLEARALEKAISERT